MKKDGEIDTNSTANILQVLFKLFQKFENYEFLFFFTELSISPIIRFTEIF